MAEGLYSGKESANAVHPGLILYQALNEMSITQKELSDAIGKSAPVINDIIKGKRNISPEVAYMLEAVIEGISAEDWLALQGQYDLAKIREDDSIVKKKDSIKSWNHLKNVLNLGYLKKKIGLTGTVEENVAHVCKYFGVNSVEDIVKLSSDVQAYFHKSSKHLADPVNMMTWMIMVRKRSNDEVLDTRFNKKLLASMIQELNIAFYNNRNTASLVKNILNRYGIKYLEEVNLEKTPVDGYSFWDGDNPTIAVTRRYNRIDNYAFAVMHELGHIVLHLISDKSQNFVDSESPNNEDEKEKEANTFAVTALRRDVFLEDYFNRWFNPFSVKGEIIQLSDKYKIHRSIITGQFQHYKNNYAICRDLLDPIL